jgi:hypothetical protein
VSLSTSITACTRTSDSGPALCPRPSQAYNTSAIKIAGVTVQTMCLMCSINVAPAIAGARFVVSDKGYILSPK